MRFDCTPASAKPHEKIFLKNKIKWSSLQLPVHQKKLIQRGVVDGPYSRVTHQVIFFYLCSINRLRMGRRQINFHEENRPVSSWCRAPVCMSEKTHWNSVRLEYWNWTNFEDSRWPLWPSRERASECEASAEAVTFESAKTSHGNVRMRSFTRLTTDKNSLENKIKTRHMLCTYIPPRNPSLLQNG